MRVETFTERYRDDVIRLGTKFHAKYLNEHYGKIDMAVVNRTINLFDGEKSRNAFLLIVDEKCVGLLAGVEVASECTNQKFFQEILWYIEEPYGHLAKYLITHAQKMLKSYGFSSMILCVMENIKSLKVEKMYERLGFNKLETHYARAL